MLLLFATLATAWAVESQHRIALGAGYFSHAYIDQQYFQWEEGEDDPYPSPYTHGTIETLHEEVTSPPIHINLHYECALGKHFGVGLCLGYDYLKIEQDKEINTSVGDETTPDGETYSIWETTHEYGELHRHILYFMPEGTVYWFKKKHVSMYSKLGVGFRVNFEKKIVYTTDEEEMKYSETAVCLQFTPVSVEVGGKAWRGFLELGYGTQGIAQLGVKYTFQGREKTEKGEE